MLLLIIENNRRILINIYLITKKLCFTVYFSNSFNIQDVYKCFITHCVHLVDYILAMWSPMITKWNEKWKTLHSHCQTNLSRLLHYQKYMMQYVIIYFENLSNYKRNILYSISILSKGIIYISVPHDRKYFSHQRYPNSPIIIR